MSSNTATRRAIVTGASRGIGYASAQALADDGVEVAICARGEDDLEQAVKDLQARGVRARGWSMDVAEPAPYRRWLDDAVGWLGGLDVFVGNVSGLMVGCSSPWTSEPSNPRHTNNSRQLATAIDRRGGR